MRSHFDKKTVQRSFQPGDSVLVLLPVPGSVFDAKFSGPYVIEQKLNDTDYVLNTPDRRRKKRVCHINLLKRYVTRTLRWSLYLQEYNLDIQHKKGSENVVADELSRACDGD